MKVLKKQALSATVIILMLASMVSVAIVAQSVKAVDTFATYGYIGASPNPVGVNQPTLINMFLSNLMPVAPGVLNLPVDYFNGFTVKITKPDGTVETRGPFKADAVSSAYFTYVPDQIGTYTLVLHYPGQVTTSPSFNMTWLPCDSNPLTLTVLSETPVIPVSATPLPSTYWTRPINGQNFGWGSVGNNWLMPGWDTTTRQFDQGCAYVPYASAPNSAHILWTKPMAFGGIVGGEFGSSQWTDGRSYEQYFKPPVIISGRLYYNTIQANEPITQMNYSTITCVDLNNGETLFTIPNATLTFGQIYNYVSPNQAGALAYLWEVRGTTWRMFDAWTGAYLLSIANVPSGTILLDNTFYGKSKAGPGDVLVYSFNANAKTLTLWNSSKCIPTLGSTGGVSVGTNAWQWRPANILGATLNAVGNSTYFQHSINAYVTVNTDGRQWVKDISSTMPTGGSPSIKQVGYDDVVYISNGTIAQPIFAFPPVTYWSGYSMTGGSYLFGPTLLDATSKLPTNATLLLPASVSAVQVIGPNDILPMWVKETMQFFAWNVRTGQFLWGPTTPLNNSFGFFNWESKFMVNGVLYNWGYDGMIHAYNLTTGQLMWEFSTGDAGSLTPYGTWPIYNGLTVADGKLFATTSDHGNGVEPLYQGEGLYVLDPVTGEHKYNITGWFEQPAIADGKLLSHNCYDNQIYCFGKGPSAVTEATSPKVLAIGSTLLIEGSVMDVSPGAKQLVRDGKFSEVPAISDDDMSAWMAYLYEQQSLSHAATGVPVSLDTVDPNGNFIHIGDTTSDGGGHFAFSWPIPAVPGTYTIIATFAGSNSYWPSHEETHVIVTEAPPPTAPPEKVVFPPIESYFVYATVAIIVAIAIVGILLLRRKP